MLLSTGSLVKLILFRLSFSLSDTLFKSISGSVLKKLNQFRLYEGELSEIADFFASIELVSNIVFGSMVYQYY
ncbi:hypothetical protein C9J03_21015 [Photobacterium gaetbulicola]|nr:hypothetical protein C9J03_21015 [Photobacterium gaetbulicola]